jgi:hypothetical protein
VPLLQRLFGILLGLSILALFIGVPFFVLTGGIEKFAIRPLRRCFAGIATRESPEPGDVLLVYHTYRGFLVWVAQDEHRLYATPDDALKLLGRFLRFNLTWGLLSYGVLFIPIFSIASYFAQKRSIASQQAR